MIGETSRSGAMALFIIAENGKIIPECYTFEIKILQHKDI